MDDHHFRIRRVTAKATGRTVEVLHPFKPDTAGELRRCVRELIAEQPGLSTFALVGLSDGGRTHAGYVVAHDWRVPTRMVPEMARSVLQRRVEKVTDAATLDIPEPPGSA